MVFEFAWKYIVIPLVKLELAEASAGQSAHFIFILFSLFQPSFFCSLYLKLVFENCRKINLFFYAIIDNPAKALKSSSADAESPLYGADKIKIFFQQRDLKSAFGSFALGLEFYKMRLLAMKLRKQSDFISPLKTFFTFSPQLVRLSRIFENWSFLSMTMCWAFGFCQNPRKSFLTFQNPLNFSFMF